MARVKSLAGRPIEQHDSPNKGGAMSGHRGIVLHIAQGYYRGTINWQMNPDQRYSDGTRVTTCSTFVVGRETGEWAQMVDSNLIAWCQRDGSRTWLSIELAGFAPAPPSAWQVEACAQLLVWSARMYGHPVSVADNESERGLGHHSMDREQFGVEWGHDSCPGPGVIGAKDDIVRRALAIQAGDDMPTADEIAAAVWARTISSPSLDRTAPAADWLKDALIARRAIDALAARPPADVDEAALAQHLAPLMQPGVTVEQIKDIIASVRLTAA